MRPRYLHIGSWNIEHFGKEDDNPDNPYAIAEHIEMAGVDILALQEIYVTDKRKFTNKHLDQAVALITEHTGHDWKYQLFRNRSRGDTSQLCGIAWNSSIVKKKKVYRIPVKTKVTVNQRKYNLWDRTPHAVKFSAGDGYTDVVIIPLHMKANTDKRYIVTRTRHEEVKTLMTNMTKVQAETKEKDIIIIGDTNCLRREEEAVKEFVKNGFEDLNDDDEPTFFRGDAPFDRIFIPSDESRIAFRYSRQYVLRSASPLSHDRYLSDHYLVKTTVKIRKDDD